jgi:hypothetical protein
MGADGDGRQAAVVLAGAVVAAAFYIAFDRAIGRIHFKSILSCFLPPETATKVVSAESSVLCGAYFDFFIRY